MNYGMVAAELILKVGLLRLHNLEGKLGIPLYPIIGAGSAPFRGHLGPTNAERSLVEYPSAQTFTVQSAFKYDYDRNTVRDGINKILAHERTDPMFIDQNRAKDIIDRSTAEYQSLVQDLTGVITSVSPHVPRRRERKMHVGLFGYGRSLGGVGGVTLPRAIGFAASLYSIGVPPELLGLACISESDLEFIREVYPNLDEDLRAALRFTNERHVRELLGDNYMNIVRQFTDELDRVHEGLTSAIWASVASDDETTRRFQFVEEAAQLRHFLG